MTVAPHDEALWQADPENCCSAVKVGQLDRALAGKAAWMSGLRRDEAPTRANAPILARDLRGLVKVNPLANWTAGQVDAYIAEHDIMKGGFARQMTERLEAAAQAGRFASLLLIAPPAFLGDLRAALGDVVGLVHGQMPPADKDAAMRRFVAGQTAVLVATTVIEVGVNVPNASIMVIERAEIFGLAQLHQLRGRVGRGTAASTCLLMYQAPLGESGTRRLKVIRDTEDGFRISEEDLAMRGAGDLIGTAQSGLPRFRVADLERQTSLMAVAQSDARRLLMEDPSLATPRGLAVRNLLWLLDQDRAIRLLSVG
jgi:hypothetical protein